jgi:predicted nucleotidyltransferase
LSNLILRDRDAIVTREGLIFRVLGYSHPSNAYICDLEYAPEEHFRSENPKALRTDKKKTFYKFYEDEGWQFLRSNFTKYLMFHDMLDKKTIGVKHKDIVKVRKPDERLQSLVKTEPKDELIAAMQNALKILTRHSSLTTKDFGVFGSILQGFYHPRFSDLDFVLYGKRNWLQLRQTLQQLHSDEGSLLRNEFETDESIKGKRWRFMNLTPKEFLWHQRRKLIYSLFKDEKSGRAIKTELEPAKDWKEIANEYDPATKIIQRGWVKMLARITKDDDAPFMPSVYNIEPLRVLEGATYAHEATLLVSYIEEFRIQAFKDETVYIEGNLEDVRAPEKRSIQISLTYCPRYYEQVLKVNAGV